MTNENKYALRILVGLLWCMVREINNHTLNTKYTRSTRPVDFAIGFLLWLLWVLAGWLLQVNSASNSLVFGLWNNKDKVDQHSHRNHDKDPDNAQNRHCHVVVREAPAFREVFHDLSTIRVCGAHEGNDEDSQEVHKKNSCYDRKQSPKDDKRPNPL